MRYGWAYIYESPPATARFEELVEILGRCAIVLENPATKEIARLSPYGERIVCTKQDILKECEESNDAPFQLWLDASTDLYCSIAKIGREVVRESYSLDGKTDQECMRVIQSLIHLFARRAERRVPFALVVDRYAELHRDFHWDDFIVGTATTPPEWPMYLGFSKTFGKLKNVPPSYRSVDKGDYVLFNSENSRMVEFEAPKDQIG
jgi:hypothetical protein